MGLWLALDDATEANGCLWLRNASHREPMRRVFVRDREPHEPDPNMVFVLTPPYKRRADHGSRRNRGYGVDCPWA